MKNIDFNFDSEKSIYKTQIGVLVSHLNYGNHLGHDSLFSILQEARMRWLKSNNMSEGHVGDNVGYLIVEVSASYRAESYHGDMLEIEFYPSNIKRATFTINYRVQNILNKKLVAYAKTEQACFDYSKKTISRIPNQFLQILKNESQSK